MAATGATAYNVLQNNGAAAHQAVFHVHFHIIPKPEGGGGLGIGWPAGRLDPAVATELAARSPPTCSGGRPPPARRQASGTASSMSITGMSSSTT